jgi:glycosyltransferase involved in cell wall biosynthesis
MTESEILVSVVISTYNCKDTIIETLDSIFFQEYSNIELIISDDASTDNSLEIVSNWLREPSVYNRFSDVKVLEVPKNTGTSANANRGINASTGSWVKFLGADDTLLPTCIKDNVSYIKKNKEIRVLFSKVNVYMNDFRSANFLYTAPGEVNSNSIFQPDRTAESQYRLLLFSDRIHFSPSVFLCRETVQRIGGFDERFRLLEDYPLWLNLTRTGHRLYFMDKITVNYRTHARAVNNTGVKQVVNPNYFKQEKFRRIYTYPNLPTDIRFDQRFTWIVSQPFRLSFLNRNSNRNLFIFKLVTIYLNPFKYVIWARKRVFKYLKKSDFYNN